MLAEDHLMQALDPLDAIEGTEVGLWVREHPGNVSEAAPTFPRMTTRALATWNGSRSAGLDRLVDAHRAVAGVGSGRRWITTEINHALIVRLASEFQGFCRDLHDEVALLLVASKLGSDPEFAGIVELLLGNGRKLDRRNANWANVCDDFGRFGVPLADELRDLNPSRYSTWIAALDRLNNARNAIVHDDRPKLVEWASIEPLTLKTFRRWRRVLGAITRGMDEVLRAYLTDDPAPGGNAG